MAYFILALFGALFGLAYLLTIPSDPKHSFLFGYSPSRLILVTFFLATIIGTGIITLKLWRNPRWMQKIDALFFANAKTAHWVLYISSMAFIIFGLSALMPLPRFGHYAAHAERLRPVILFFVQLSFQTAILILHRIGRLHWKSFVQEIRAHRLTLWIAAVCMIIFGALWIVVSRTGIGIAPMPQTNWYESGVPVLAIQVVASALIALAITGLMIWLQGQSPPKIGGIRGADILLGIAIWALTAILWSQAPLPPNNFFAPGPYPPDYAYLPYSDAASFDMSAQYALAGQGIAGGDTYKGHNAYLGFLAFLHLLAGQDYSLLVTWQVVIFAVFPVIVYLIGKALHGRLLGLFMAGLVVMQELNAVASGSRLNLSHSKLLMTEFPTKIGLAALILLLLLWLRKPERNFAYALPVGGALGILMLLRYNTLIMPFAIIAGTLLVYGKNWRLWLKTSVMLFVAMGIVISPWMWRSWQRSGNPFFFAPKLINRFKIEFQESFLPPLKQQHERMALLDTKTPVRVSFSQNIGTQIPRMDVRSSEGKILPLPPVPPIGDAARGEGWEGGPYHQISSHFLHNLITNLLILPTRPIFEFLPDAIADGSLYESVPFWKNLHTGWLTDLLPVDLVGIATNLMLLSLGIGAAFRQWKWAGLIPLGVLIAYHLATALVRDSGGRYIIPVDWIMLLYFALGLLQIADWGLIWFGFTRSVSSASIPQSWGDRGATRTALLLTLPFFIYTLSMTVLDQAIPPKYTPLSKAAVVERLDQAGVLDQTSFDAADLENSLTQALNHPDFRAVYGLSLYPRFFAPNQGLHRGIYLDHPFPRLAFTMITASGPEYILLPLEQTPPTFPHGTDVIVIGCQSIDRRGLWHIDALLVAQINTAPPTIYTRTPAAPFPLCPADISPDGGESRLPPTGGD